MALCLDCGKKCTGKRCKECFIKFSGKSFDFGEWHFDTQTELDKTIKIFIAESPRNEEFNNPFLISFVNKYHPEISKRDLKLTKLKILDYYGQVGKWEFCRDRFRGGIYVIGYFEPINEWHGVTLYPHKRRPSDIRQKLIWGLRQKWSEKAKKREIKDICEICGGSYPHLHHESESFKNIAEECLKEFSEKEINEGIGEDWWLHENEADAIPNTHPAVIKLHELHYFIKYKWLCSECHKKEHGYS
jgi:hypothetical protein